MIDDIKIKEKARQMVSHAEYHADNLKGVIIAECDEMRLTYHLRGIYEGYGAAKLLSYISHDDDEESRKLWKQASDAYTLGNNFRDRFSKECICKRLEKI